MNYILSLAIGTAGNVAWYFSDHATWAAHGWIVCAMLSAVIACLPSRNARNSD